MGLIVLVLCSKLLVARRLIKHVFMWGMAWYISYQALILCESLVSKYSWDTERDVPALVKLEVVKCARRDQLAQPPGVSRWGPSISLSTWHYKRDNVPLNLASWMWKMKSSWIFLCAACIWYPIHGTVQCKWSFACLFIFFLH